MILYRFVAEDILDVSDGPSGIEQLRSPGKDGDSLFD